ncbi:MAG: hypothetical protein K0M45_02845 [Candidatus Paracaedibacteraceae bacterium]|nr:hypothetical protein [Candidatus Paracaedibacteraceae bacterium]
MEKEDMLKKVILLSILWVNSLIQMVGGVDTQSMKREGLCDYVFNNTSHTLSYKLGHASTLKPEELELLIKKGNQKLLDIVSNNNRPNSHDLTIFKDYNRHNSYYFKNGVTLSNLFDWVKSYIPWLPSAPPNEKIQACVETFVSIIWALVDLSWQRSDEFNRGAIIIEDKDKKIHNYLEQLILFCAGVTQPSELNNGIYTILGSNIGYNRLGQSSHFPGRQLTHYGFDARFEIQSFALPVLPFGMTHVLFGRGINHRGEEVTFIKPEEAGIADVRSLLLHTYCFFAPIPPGTILRREKDIPPPIAQEIYILMKRIYSHREMFASLQQDEKLRHLFKKIETSDLESLYFESTKEYDISWLMMILSQLKLKGDVPDDIQVQINKLKELLIAEFNEESLSLRSGNEVLFLDPELRYISIAE